MQLFINSSTVLYSKIVLWKYTTDQGEIKAES